MRILTVFFMTLAMGSVAIPARADLGSCIGKMNKRNGLVAYYFKGASPEGTVQWSVRDLGLPNTHGEENSPSDFTNTDRCQSKGKGKACVTTSDLKLATIPPASCVMYLYDAGTNSTCEARVLGCQPAERPLPTSGFHAINNTQSTTACWDAATGTEWHIPDWTVMKPPGEEPMHEMSEEGARILLNLANGEALWVKTDDWQVLHNVPQALSSTGVKLAWPTLADLTALRNECEGLFRGCVPTDPCQISFGMYSSTFVQSECAAQICSELFSEQGICVFSDTTVWDETTGDQNLAVVVRSSGDSVGSAGDILTVRAKQPNDLCRSVFIAPSFKTHRFSDPDLVTDNYIGP